MQIYIFEEDLIQNLKDAGCDNDTISKFIGLSESKKIKDELNLLSKQRKNLLDNLHKIEKSINCLDYLVYQINQRRG
jgi:hypothetical protein